MDHYKEFLEAQGRGDEAGAAAASQQWDTDFDLEAVPEIPQADLPPQSFKVRTEKELLAVGETVVLHGSHELSAGKLKGRMLQTLCSICLMRKRLQTQSIFLLEKRCFDSTMAVCQYNSVRRCNFLIYCIDNLQPPSGDKCVCLWLHGTPVVLMMTID